MAVRPLYSTAFAAVLALLLAAGAAAQEAPAEKPSAPPPEPAVVPIGEIGARSDALKERLGALSAESPKQTLEAISEQLKAAQEKLAPALERVEEVLSRRYSPSELEDLRSRWRALAQEFGALQDRVGAQADALDASLKEIAEQTELWKRTLEEARSTQAPAAVRRQIEGILAELATAKKQVDRDVASTFALHDRVSSARSALRPTLERIETAQRELAAGLLVRQDEPIWRAVPSADGIAELASDLAATMTAVGEDFARFSREHRDPLIVQVLLFLVLAAFFSRLRSRRAGPGPERRAPASDAFRHPWAAAFLVATLMTPFLQTERSVALRLALTPPALLAWFLVLSGMLAPALRLPLAGLGVLFLVDFFRVVLTGVPLLYRAVLVLELAAALAGVVWLRRSRRLKGTPWRDVRGPWLWLLTGWLRLLEPTVAAGVLAVLLGYTSLADRIAIVAIGGTVVGAAWVALVRIAEGVIEYAVEAGALDRVRMVRSGRPVFLRVLRWGLRAGGLFAWTYVTLTAAGLWTLTRGAVGEALSTSIGYGPVSLSLGGVLAFFFTLWISWLLSRFIAFALEQEVFTRVRMPPGVPFALSTFTRYGILVVGFLLAVGAIGFSLDRVTLLLSALGVGIGFGLQNVVNNFVSGAILLFERPIRVGDRVQLDDLFGIVSTIGIRASKVHTFDGSDVIVPNGDFVSAKVVNWTLADRRRRIILPVGVAYGTKPRQVIELLREVARSHPEVLSEPEPVVLFRAFGNSSLDFEIRAFTEGDWISVMSDLAVATSEALEAAGIQIPFPQRDLHLRNVAELRDAFKEVLEPPGGGSSRESDPD